MNTKVQTEIHPSLKDPLPATGKTVIVQCDGFRCLAYRDPNGKWRGAFDHGTLPGVVTVLPDDAPLGNSSR